ncbi:MAG: hypothetical protein ACI4Q8_02625 [Ruminococcus sp.]
MTELEREKTALFIVIRNNMVMPNGLKLGKSMEEINRMSYATMIEVYKIIDFERSFECYKQGERDYFFRREEMTL